MDNREMVFREKVINGFEHCSEYGCKGCPYKLDCTMADSFILLAKDALELLKAQEIIRCAECKHWHINCMENAGRHGCDVIGDYTGPDYYCASAEMRNNEGQRLQEMPTL